MTWILWIQCQRFSESLEKDLSNGTIKVDIREIKVFANLAIPWIIAHGPRPKNGPNEILDWNISFEIHFSKLSENHKYEYVDIGSTVLKLWLLKDVQLHPHPPPFNQSFQLP